VLARWNWSTHGYRGSLGADLRARSILPIEDAWAGLDRIQAVLRSVGLLDSLPEPVGTLVRRRGHSWLDMVTDFNWALHLVACAGDDVLARRLASQEETESLRHSLSLCRVKCRQFPVDFNGQELPTDSLLEQQAEKLSVDCPYRADVADDPATIIVGPRAGPLFDALARSDLLNDNDEDGRSPRGGARRLAAPGAVSGSQTLPFWSVATARGARSYTRLCYARRAKIGTKLIEWLLGQRLDLVRHAPRAGRLRSPSPCNTAESSWSSCFWSARRNWSRPADFGGQLAAPPACLELAPEATTSIAEGVAGAVARPARPTQPTSRRRLCTRPHGRRTWPWSGSCSTSAPHWRPNAMHSVDTALHASVDPA